MPVPAILAAPSVPHPTRSTWMPWVDEMDGRGARLIGDRIRPDRDATTVRVRDNKVLLTDGPYAETKDLVAGFDVIECADLDEAVEIASKHPMARDGVSWSCGRSGPTERGCRAGSSPRDPARRPLGRGERRGYRVRVIALGLVVLVAVCVVVAIVRSKS